MSDPIRIEFVPGGLGDQKVGRLTVYCPNGVNAPRYRECLSAICYGTEAIKVSGSLRLISPEKVSQGEEQPFKPDQHFKNQHDGFDAGYDIDSLKVTVDPSEVGCPGSIGWIRHPTLGNYPTSEMIILRTNFSG